MPSLCIYIFFALFHLFDFSFPTLHFIIHSIRTATVKNKCCVFLVSTLNDFCFIENAVSVSSNSYQLRHISNPVNYQWWSFLKKLALFFSCWLFCHKSYRTDVCWGLKFASNPNIVTFFYPEFSFKTVLVDNYNKKENMSDEVVFLIMAHSLTRNFQVRKNCKRYPSERLC